MYKVPTASCVFAARHQMSLLVPLWNLKKRSSIVTQIKVILQFIVVFRPYGSEPDEVSLPRLQCARVRVRASACVCVCVCLLLWGEGREAGFNGEWQMAALTLRRAEEMLFWWKQHRTCHTEICALRLFTVFIPSVTRFRSRSWLLVKSRGCVQPAVMWAHCLHAVEISLCVCVCGCVRVMWD